MKPQLAFMIGTVSLAMIACSIYLLKDWLRGRHTKRASGRHRGYPAVTGSAPHRLREPVGAGQPPFDQYRLPADVIERSQMVFAWREFVESLPDTNDRAVK
jgi:hypothetical protein